MTIARVFVELVLGMGLPMNPWRPFSFPAPAARIPVKPKLSKLQAQAQWRGLRKLNDEAVFEFAETPDKKSCVALNDDDIAVIAGISSPGLGTAASLGV